MGLAIVGNRVYELSPLDTAEIVAGKHGFYNLDLKNNDVGDYMLVAYRKGGSLTSRGKTLTQAVDKLLNMFWSETQ